MKVELSVEQQFELKAFETQVNHMSREEAQRALVGLYKQYIEQQVIYQNLIAHSWGITS